MFEYATAGIEPGSVVILVECGPGGHVDGWRVVVVVVIYHPEGASLPRTVGQQRVDLPGLRLEVEHLGPQEAARSCGVCATYVLLLAAVVSVVACSARLLLCSRLICLRICIVVRGLGKRRRPTHAPSSLRTCAIHLTL